MKKHIVLTLIFSITTIFTTSCFSDLVFINGSGNVVTETLDIDDFNGINLEGVEDVIISYGETQEVVVSGDDNIIDRIKTNVSGGIWYVGLERGSYRDYELKYDITVPKINKITNEGVADVVVNDFEDNGDLFIKIEGLGKVELNRMANTENLTIDIDGAGQVVGYKEFPDLQKLDIYVDGAGRFLAFPIETADCNIDISGTGRCEVSVEENLDIYIDGAGSVYYKGFPSITQDVSGVATIKSTN